MALDPFGGALAGLFGSAASSAGSYAMMKSQQAFQKKMYRNRYQFTMKDMEAAGLNPILAYKQGAGSVGSQGGTPSLSNPGLAAVEGAKGASASQLNKAQKNLAEESAGERRTQSLLNVEKTRLINAQATREQIMSPFWDLVGRAVKGGTRMFEDEAVPEATKAVDQWLADPRLKEATRPGRTNSARDAKQRGEAFDKLIERITPRRK